jgi:hypothetical protein
MQAARKGITADDLSEDLPSLVPSTPASDRDLAV